MRPAIMNTAMDRALDALDEALRGVDDVAAQLRLAAESLVLDFLHHPAEVTICNVEVRSLDHATRPAIIAKRDRYAYRVRSIIDAGGASRRFATATPQLVAYTVLELGNGAKSWFAPAGALTKQQVATAYGEFALLVVQDAGPASPL